MGDGCRRVIPSGQEGKGCLGILGAIVLGAAVPAVLVFIQRESMLSRYSSLDPALRSTWYVLWEALTYIITAVMWCGPGYLFLGGFLYLIAFNLARVGYGKSQAMALSILNGCFLVILNFPGWFFFGEFSRRDSRLIVLMMVSGATAGVLLGWQGWRSFHTEERFLPQYSLKWLLGVAVVWSVVLGLFVR